MVECPPVRVSIILLDLLSGLICSSGHFQFQPGVHNWLIKGCGMYCPVCGKVHIKDPPCSLSESVAFLATAGSYARIPLPSDMKINVL